MRTASLIILSLLLPFASADDSLWRALKQDPNMIVLIRNTESVGNRNGANMLVWDETGECIGESVLTDDGHAHAKKIGSEFSEHGIQPIVISSPMCRCTDTAEAAFGKYISDPELRQRPATETEGHASFQIKAAELLRRHRGSAPIVLVNHRPNIDSLTMELIDIGDLLVGTVSESGDIEVLGKLRVDP